MSTLSKMNMCGIVGIISKEEQDLIPEAILALRDLEYRGYDSAGLGFIHNNELKTYKCLGAPSEKLHAKDVYTKTNTKSNSITTVIGHTRWATHGKPSVKNAHPHTDCENRIAVVHNGAILNYEALKRSLEHRGHVFTSDTDTEVIAHSIEEALKHEKKFEDAFLHVIKMLEGSFGIVAIDRKDPGKLYVAKNGSPLNIGMTDTMFIVASSVNVLLRYTKHYIPLSDKEFAVLNASGEVLQQEVYQFKDKKSPTTKQLKVIKGASVDDLSKEGYDTFMLKEIYEQPKTTQASMLGRYNKKTGDAVLGGFVDYDAFLKKIVHICTIGCGTAHNAAKVGKEVIEKLTDIVVCNEIASEFRYKTCNLKPNNSFILAISQSGETADTLEALKKAKRDKFKTFGVVNVVGSAISNETDAGEFTRAGTEIGVASTKAFTAQLVVLYLLGIKLARARTLDAKAGKHLLSTLENIPKHMDETLKLDTEIRTIAKKFKKVRNISFLGRGIHVPIADEASLKFKELTYIETGNYPLGELKHGPIAVVDKDHLSVIIMPKDELFALSKNSIEQIKSKGGKVLIITDKSAKRDPIIKKADAVVFIPTIKESIFYPLLEIIPLQLFAYHFATQLGMNVDKPRNLAKSVTVE
jgi:glucosamine--fructose-6-phosphate aminotransferase (isomerizing)